MSGLRRISICMLLALTTAVAGAQSLVGKWEKDPEDRGRRYCEAVFNKDGTGHYLREIDSGELPKTTFTWVLKGKKLTVNYKAIYLGKSVLPVKKVDVSDIAWTSPRRVRLKLGFQSRTDWFVRSADRA